MRLNALYLGSFLGTRLIGYMLFALVAAQLGRLAALSTHAPLFGVVYLLLALVLLVYAHSAGSSCAPAACAGNKLVTIGVTPRHGVPGAALLGLLTGINLCPPFIIAGVRAAQLGSVAGALLFFLAFFVGTSMWFLPFIGIGYIRRNEAIFTVARMAMVLIALYYGLVGAAMLFGRRVYGY
jgi:sulfite exporter TauE/SafE